ncbi:hypothetical protein V2J09_001987 [Rumex salicifolius]
MAGKMTMKIPVAVFWVAVVLAAVAVAEEATAANGWQESVSAAAGDVKDKAEEAVEGAKSWTGWAVGKLSEKFNEEKKEEDSKTATEKIGEAKDKVIKMATGTQEKANQAYESAKETVSSQAKAGYDAGKEKTTGDDKPGDHIEL